MRRLTTPARLAATIVIIVFVSPACAQHPGKSAPIQDKPATTRANKLRGAEQPVRLAVHVSDNDPKVMNLALNNVGNVIEHYKAQGRPIAIEVVAYGPGLHMLRADTSPVKDRIAQMSLEHPVLKFSACRNTRNNMQKQEAKDVALLGEAVETPSGVARLIELQAQGFAYLKP